MTGGEYQCLAARTIGCDKYEDMLIHGIAGLASEAGEVSGLLQKVYQGHPLELEHLVKELGDCLWMIAEICTSLEMSMDDVMETNIEKLARRYPDGFSAERSQHREKGDI